MGCLPEPAGEEGPVAAGWRWGGRIDPTEKDELRAADLDGGAFVYE